jgi:hypothetical protein
VEFLILGRLNELRCQSVLLLLAANHALLADLMKLLQLYRSHHADTKNLMLGTDIICQICLNYCQ